MFFKNVMINLKKYSFLLQQLVSRDFKVKYKRSVLGIVWSLLYPILTMVVMAIVFSNVFKFSTPGVSYLAYLLSGLIMFNYFSEASNLSMSSVVGNFGLLNKIYIPEIDVILYWGNITDTFIDMHFAGINKIEMEKNDYLQEKHSINNINVEEIANYLKIKCYKDADFARNVRKRGKNFADCIGTLEGAYVLLKEKFGKEKVTTEILGRVAEDFYNL